MFAAGNGHTDTVRLLLGRGADLTLQDKVRLRGELQDEVRPGCRLQAKVRLLWMPRMFVGVRLCSFGFFLPVSVSLRFKLANRLWGYQMGVRGVSDA